MNAMGKRCQWANMIFRRMADLIRSIYVGAMPRERPQTSTGSRHNGRGPSHAYPVDDDYQALAYVDVTG